MEYSIDTEKYIDKMISFVKRVSGLDINLKNPVTIQDKLCWLNIYEPMKLKTKCADKLLLHEYCKEKLGVDLCVPVIKVYNNTSEINWDELPDKFVIKCNHGSGMNIIVKDKSKLDRLSEELPDFGAEVAKGFYKIATDAKGRVKEIEAVTQDDIYALGIPKMTAIEPSTIEGYFTEPTVTA